MSTRDLLLEIGTEDLPAGQLQKLSHGLANQIRAAFLKAELNHGEIEVFSTPRRLAVLVKALATEQPNRMVEKRGPAAAAAFDANGKPTPACIGFATSCGTTVEQLTVRETDKGAWVFFNQAQGGSATINLLPSLMQQALAALPMPKPMRWGNYNVAFIRPVQWVVLLFGDELVEAELLGKKTQRHTYGHRFHHPQALPLAHANDYTSQLEKTGYVVASSTARKELIKQQVTKVVSDKGAALIDENLLEEVTGLVEWPVALLGEFDKQFLDVPPETIMTAMQSHQRYFPVVDKDKKLLPYFITVSNINSTQSARVVAGNERVLRARLSDAQFFYHTDLKHRLDSRLDDLKVIIFQKELGTLFDKSQRIATLTQYLATQLNATEKTLDKEQTHRAGLLCKADLASGMVGEFSELQGIMGYYYALEDGEAPAVATAIREHYQPRFAGDAVPETTLGALVAIADKIDTLVGLFGIGQPPSGDKDPYALRRAALGVLRTIIEKRFALDVYNIIQHAATLYANRLKNTDTTEQMFEFMLDRLRAWYTDQGIDPQIFAAVRARQITQPLDFDHRVHAVQHFSTLPAATSLIAANKRVSQLLKNHVDTVRNHPLNPSLFEHDSERALLTALEQQSRHIEPLFAAADYTAVLTALATLQAPIDKFFDDVMVMVEDEAIRNNRLALLYQLQQLFLQVADIAVLTSG
jgi:glycyl-tRNA synthetase beta chain